MRRRLIDLLDGLAVVQAALIQLLNDREHVFHGLVQLHVLRRRLFSQAQAVVDILDPVLHKTNRLLRFALQPFDHLPDIVGCLRGT